MRWFDSITRHHHPVSSKVEHTTDNRATEEHYLYWVPNTGSLAQWNRVLVFETSGWEFESLKTHQIYLKRRTVMSSDKSGKMMGVKL